MRRKGGGVGAIDRERIARERYKTKGEELASEQIKKLTESVASFKDSLQEFASRYHKQIREDPDFRRAFQEMCASLGVDPLASNKGFWSEALGLGTFYYELAVQVIEVCLATRARNGGLISLQELIKKVKQSRGPYMAPIGRDDVMKAVDKVKCLGNGFRIILFNQPSPNSNANIVKNNSNLTNISSSSMTISSSGGSEKIFIQSVPGDLTVDHLTILRMVEEKSTKGQDACITLAEATSGTEWSTQRVELCLTYLIKDGMVWCDEQNYLKDARLTLYWFPTFFAAKNK